MPKLSQERALALVQIATGLGISAFWVLFYTVGIAPAQPPQCYFAFEHAFLLPDTILAVALIASGINVVRGGSWGRAVSLACGGGLLFLGVIDFSFNIRNGGFSGPVGDALQAGFLSLWCVALGLCIIALHVARPHNAAMVERQGR